MSFHLSCSIEGAWGTMPGTYELLVSACVVPVTVYFQYTSSSALIARDMMWHILVCVHDSCEVYLATVNGCLEDGGNSSD